MSCKCGERPIEGTHLPSKGSSQTTGLYWGYQHTNGAIRIKPWLPPYNDACDRCVALHDMDVPGALVGAVFPVVRAYDHVQVYVLYKMYFFEHKLDPDARFAALLDEC